MVLVPIRIAAKDLGVSPITLRRWENLGNLEAAERTASGHRRYDLTKLRHLTPRHANAAGHHTTIAYARVSSHDQKEDLVRQIGLLEAFCAANGSQAKGPTAEEIRPGRIV